eukprot:TRINITY_DN39638_c0_g1_i1.p1 TRINITY_DN39638_c0_g1~~TRINITY_DN39638_c0_g1_i1.p1  ORF type:complete len:359 (-),score=71.81 TRINITY_DN39638_c0_g1_i1:2-1024(-)
MALKPTSGDESTQVRERRKKLAKVFDELDADVTGYLSIEELARFDDAMSNHALAKGVWDDVASRKLFKAMDESGDGNVDRNEFIEYFHKRMPEDMRTFREHVAIYEQASWRAAGAGVPSTGAELVRSRRRRAIASVFDAVDGDVSGSLDREELQGLVKAASSIGPAQKEFAETISKELMRGNSVDREVFVAHFDAKMPQDPDSFARRVREMDRAADHVVRSREAKRQPLVDWRSRVAPPTEEVSQWKTWSSRLINQPVTGGLAAPLPGGSGFYRQLASHVSREVDPRTLGMRFAGDRRLLGGDDSSGQDRIVYACPCCSKLFHVHCQDKKRFFAVPVPGI